MCFYSCGNYYNSISFAFTELCGRSYGGGVLEILPGEVGNIYVPKLDMVPIEEIGDDFDYTQDELLEKARGKYSSGLDKEGIVIRPLKTEFNMDVKKRLSFKVLNNDFLLKEK